MEKINKTVISVIVILLLAVIACFACRYKVQALGNSALVVNNFTGTKELVSEKGELKTLDASGVYKGAEMKEITTSNPEMKLNCKTKWRDGKLYCEVKLDMESSKFESYKSSFGEIFITFLDEDGFEILNFEIPLGKFIHNVGSASGRWEGSYSTSMQMKLTDFRAIKKWNPAWTQYK